MSAAVRDHARRHVAADAGAAVRRGRRIRPSRRRSPADFERRAASGAIYYPKGAHDCFNVLDDLRPRLVNWLCDGSSCIAPNGFPAPSPNGVRPRDGGGRSRSGFRGCARGRGDSAAPLEPRREDRGQRPPSRGLAVEAPHERPRSRSPHRGTRPDRSTLARVASTRAARQTCGSRPPSPDTSVGRPGSAAPARRRAHPTP